MPQTRNVDIAEVLRDAQLGDLSVLAEERMGYDELHHATEALFDLLDDRGIEYVLVGGLAVLQYVPGRNTRDIDLIMSPEDLARLPEIEVASRDNVSPERASAASRSTCCWHRIPCSNGSSAGTPPCMRSAAARFAAQPRRGSSS